MKSDWSQEGIEIYRKKLKIRRMETGKQKR